MSSISAIWSQVLAGAVESSLLEQIATVLGIVGVWLMMKRNLWTFPVSLVQVAIFGWVCFHGRLYSETVLQVFFFCALVYGWWHWVRGAGEKMAGRELPITRLTVKSMFGYALMAVALWGVWGAIMQRLGAALAWADAFVFSVSVVSQWLQARKVMENWPGWIIANAAAICVFWIKEYYWFSVLYAIFLLMAWGGWNEWRAAKAKETIS